MSADDDVIVLALATDASLMHSQIFSCKRVKLVEFLGQCSLRVTHRHTLTLKIVHSRICGLS